MPVQARSRDPMRGVVRAFKDNVRITVVAESTKALSTWERLLDSPLFDVCLASSVSDAWRLLRPRSNVCHAMLLSADDNMAFSVLDMLAGENRVPPTLMLMKPGLVSRSVRALNTGVLRIHDRIEGHEDEAREAMCELGAYGYLIRQREAHSAPIFEPLLRDRVHDLKAWCAHTNLSLTRLNEVVRSNCKLSARVALAVFHGIAHALLGSCTSAGERTTRVVPSAVVRKSVKILSQKESQVKKR